MSPINNGLLFAQDDSAYRIFRSLRFNGATLSGTFGTATNRVQTTFSTWVKRSQLGGSQYLLSTSQNEGFYFSNTNFLTLFRYNSTASTTLNTTVLCADTSAWFHLHVTNNGAIVSVYINGVLVYSASNFATWTYIGVSGNLCTIGNGFAGYLADTHFIDGQVLAPTSFGEFDASGIWQPKRYTGTYGNVGFRLTYSDNSATTSTTIGADSSGRLNHMTPTGFSVLPGAGNDSMVDTPTTFGGDSGLGGELRGNYATLNALNASVSSVINGGLEYTATVAATFITGTIGMYAGKWYWEVNASGGTTQTEVGVATLRNVSSTRFALAADLTTYGLRFDADAGTLEHTSNGTTWTTIATGLTSGPYIPYFYNTGTTAKTVTVNFGQRAFDFAAPSGYKALCAANMPAPTIPISTAVVDKALYTGTGAALTISSLDFSPDFVWIKQRSTAGSNALYDNLRGATIELISDNAAAQTTQATGLTTFTSNGFTLGTLARVNTSTATYAAFCWDTDSSNTSNTSGTISSTVRANVSAGFSIVTYTGNGVAGATIGHGLGVAPTFIIIKARTAANPWNIYTTALDGSLDFFNFGTTAKTDATQAVPTSSVFSVSNSINVNASGTAYIAYCWTPVAGLSQSFSYTGNTITATYPFVYLGFRPQFALIKQATAASATGWVLAHDVSASIYPSNTAAEVTNVPVTFCANGLKLRTTLADVNASVGSYVGYAWAAFPLQYSRAN